MNIKHLFTQILILHIYSEVSKIGEISKRITNIPSKIKYL